jgi:hypothetical protein
MCPAFLGSPVADESKLEDGDCLRRGGLAFMGDVSLAITILVIARKFG